MPDYRRAWSPGGTCFFTLVTHQRRPFLIEPHARQILRQAFLRAKQQGGLPGTVSASMTQKGELGIWLRRYWEHLNPRPGRPLPPSGYHPLQPG